MKKDLAVQLQPAIKELEASRGEQLLGQFTGFIEQAGQWEKEAKAIVVTDVSQTDLMKKARTARIALKNIRTNTENTRKSLKENIVREGKAIDGMANIIKAVIVPLEAHLEEQETYAERKKAETDMQVRSERQAQMNSIGEEGFQFTSVDLASISQPEFDILYQTALNLKKQKEEAEKRLEQERLDRMKAEGEAKEKQRVENERLKKEAAERDKEIAKERAEKAKLEKELSDRQAEADRQVALAKAKKDAEEAAKTAHKALPDVEKLKSWANTLNAIESPELSTKEARDIVERVQVTLGKLSTGIIKAAEEL